MSSCEALSEIVSSIPGGTQVLITVLDTGTNAQTSEDIRLDVTYPDGTKISGHGSCVDSAVRRLQGLYPAELSDGFHGLHNKKKTDK